MPKRKQKTNLLKEVLKESKEARLARRDTQRQRALEIKQQKIEERLQRQEEMQNSLPNIQDVERTHSFIILQGCNTAKANLDESLLDEFIQFIDESNHRAASPTTSEHSAKEDISPVARLPLGIPQTTIKYQAISSCTRANKTPSDREIKSLLSDNLEFSTTYNRKLKTSTSTYDLDRELEQKAKRQKSHNLSDALTDEDRRIFMEFRYTRTPKPVSRYGEMS